MKKHKAAGRTDIAPEMILAGPTELQDRILAIMNQMWAEGTVVQDWKDAAIVPIPKKGDLCVCDNWRGISLLDVVGKLFARIIQDRLQVIAEDILPASQCGFRRGRGCVDMIFAARQLVEKTVEHDDSLFVLFVDLKKAYDSVPRSAVWTVLRKDGVPSAMLSIIKSFHKGMFATVKAGTMTSQDIEVHNGLRQGCPLAPSLFNLYICAMVANWRDCCPQTGVNVLYKHGRKLVSDCTAKSKLNRTKITESQFNDAAVYTTTHSALEDSTRMFADTAQQWGLTVSTSKTKGLVVGHHTIEEEDPVTVGSDVIEIVPNFTYLGSIITQDGQLESELSSRIAKAARAFGCLRESIFTSRKLSTDANKCVYKAVVISTLLYGAEIWNVKAVHLKRLNAFHNRCVRCIMGVTCYQQWTERITSRQLSNEFGMEGTISDILCSNRLRWLGHVARMEDNRMPKQLLFEELQRTRPTHGPKIRWRDVARGDLLAAGITSGWYELAQDRHFWFHATDPTNMPPTAATRCPVIQSGNGAFTCPCGRSFRRRGDRTQQQAFCGASTSQV